jgi:hypothetical protein
LDPLNEINPNEFMKIGEKYKVGLPDAVPAKLVAVVAPRVKPADLEKS